MSLKLFSQRAAYGVERLLLRASVSAVSRRLSTTPAYQHRETGDSLREAGRKLRLRQRESSTQPVSPETPTQYINQLEQQDSAITFETDPKEFSKHCEDFERYFHFPEASQGDDFRVGNTVTIHGFLVRRRVQGARLMFANVSVPNGPRIQIVSTWSREENVRPASHQALQEVPLQSPVALTGRVAKLVEGKIEDGPTGSLGSGFAVELCPDSRSKAQVASFPDNVREIEITLQDVQVLNPFPESIRISHGVQFGPESRHLQIKFSQNLQLRLEFRDYVNRRTRHFLGEIDFREYETPVLFKLTPEGAREFIVPTRRSGCAYALAQSPQQYKQLLMASGVSRYYQFARCFRDEDLRADRQPEFTQLDLEMAFATGEDVMRVVEALIQDLYQNIRQHWSRMVRESNMVPVRRGHSVVKTASSSSDVVEEYPDIDTKFKRISFDEAMSRYGSDKPDLRIPNSIHRIDHIVFEEFKQMITTLKCPVVEACRFRLGSSITAKRTFIKDFMASLPRLLGQNPDGAPVVLIYDSSQPLNGFASLGHEGLSALMRGVPDFADLQDGDLLLVQARQGGPTLSRGGTTALGNLRNEMYRRAIEEDLLPPDHNFQFVWITDFPLFTPVSDTDDTKSTSQGGASFSATHHPFTAPATSEDFRLLATNPQRAKADHYDLVVNGVELGGGSRRIHVAAVQEFVMKNVLQLHGRQIEQFHHLLRALKAGCPPHAGFALGFDRLVAVLSGTSSIRDVIAFPKSMKGEDLLVGSPSHITAQHLLPYHLNLENNIE